MTTLEQAKKHIDSISRPTGYNNYAWQVTKKVALEVWDCHLSNQPFTRSINYFCQEFYKMLQKPDGSYIVSPNSFRTL